MAAGPPGQWASVIFVAAQVHTRVRFLFLPFSILTILLISHYISNFFSLTFVILIFFLFQKKKYIYYFFHSNFSLLIFLFFSLLFLLNTFFFFT